MFHAIRAGLRCQQEQAEEREEEKRSASQEKGGESSGELHDSQNRRMEAGCLSKNGDSRGRESALALHPRRGGRDK